MTDKNKQAPEQENLSQLLQIRRDKLRELQVDLRATPAIFTGGGAALFRSFLESSPQVAKAEFVAGPKANAVGYGMLATAQLRQMQAQKVGEGFAQG